MFMIKSKIYMMRSKYICSGQKLTDEENTSMIRSFVPRAKLTVIKTNV